MQGNNRQKQKPKKRNRGGWPPTFLTVPLQDVIRGARHAVGKYFVPPPRRATRTVRPSGRTADDGVSLSARRNRSTVQFRCMFDSV